MKKIISIILSSAVITASAAVPVFADYEATSYDVEMFNYTYDDGTVVNSIDGTNAKKVTDTEVVVDAASDTSIFTKEFFWTFDFCLDSAEDGSVPGVISIEKKKSNGNVDKQGPNIYYKEGSLVTATGSNGAAQTLGSVSPDTWYTAEIEGKMVVTGATCNFRLYSYEDGEKTLVQETAVLNLRQFYAGSSNGVPNCMKATNLSIDNVKFISEYPDELVLSSTADEINAGSTAALDYVAKRLGTEVTKHSVTWSVWDESGDTEITDGSAEISSDGVLSTDVYSPTQMVTVKATTEVGAEPLTGEYKITVNEVDTGSEKFDSIEILGTDSVKAGTKTAYSFKAYKSGVEVTDSISSDDVTWSIYNGANLVENKNKNISITDGELSIDDSVIKQNITVRAASKSGKIYGSKSVAVDFSEKQLETVIAYNACEESTETVSLTDSIDGSSAYLINESTTIGFSNLSDYAMVEFDVKFTENYSGFIFKRNDGSENSSFYYKDGTISQQTGGSKYSSLTSAESGKWYHMQILYKDTNASCNIYAYNDDGSLTLVKTALDISRRNGKQFGKIEFKAGTYIDNVLVVSPIADAVEITAPGSYIFAGETANYTSTASRFGLPLNDYSGITWSVLDESNLPIIDGSVTVTDGVVSIDSMASPQTVTVVAETASGAKAEAKLTIQTTEVFKITNLGVNEDATKLVKLYVEKNFAYDDDVTFIITIKNSEGELKAVKLINSFGDRYSLGKNAITIDFELPTDFNSETDTIETMVWTAL